MVRIIRQARRLASALRGGGGEPPAATDGEASVSSVLAATILDPMEAYQVRRPGRARRNRGEEAAASRGARLGPDFGPARRRRSRLRGPIATPAPGRDWGRQLPPR